MREYRELRGGSPYSSRTSHLVFLSPQSEILSIESIRGNDERRAIERDPRGFRDKIEKIGAGAPSPEKTMGEDGTTTQVVL